MSCVTQQQLQQSAIGVVIEITVEEDGVIVDLSTSLVRTFYFKKPNGKIISRTALFTTDGTDGKLRYTTVSGDLDTAGTWRVQAFLDFPGSGFEGRGDIGSFIVKANL